MSPLVAATYVVLLFILVLLSVINFINHFQFNFKCPYIIRDVEVGGIYPTFILIYIIISSIILSTIVVLISYEHEAHVLLSYSFCEVRFSLYSDSVFDFSFMNKSGDNTSFALYLVVSFLLHMLLILETYFSFSRYYNVCDIQHRYPLSTSFMIYCVLFIICVWFSITILPIIIVFLCIQHILTITYFSYYFDGSIRASYRHVLTASEFGHTDSYNMMKLQIRQIREMSILSVISSIISAASWFSFILCSNSKQIQILPITLSINCIFLFIMFSKNRVFMGRIIHCKCRDILSECNLCSLIIQRRKQRQWIRDRQKSMFRRLQNGLTRHNIFSHRNSANISQHTHPNSINKDIVMEPHSNHTSIQVCDDIDPMNQILHSANKPRQSLSIQSDISDIFVKMKSIGQTFRHNQRHSDLDLVKELELQIQNESKQRTQLQQTVTKPPKTGNVIKTLNKDPKILKLRQKTDRQISFGADIALEMIIKEQIDIEDQDNHHLNMQNKLRLLNHSSEPVLMSSYVYEETEKMQKQAISLSVSPEEHCLPKTQSKTCPNSPDNSAIKRKRRVFLYDVNGNKEDNIQSIPNLNPLTLNRTVSEIQIPRTRVYSTSRHNSLHSDHIDFEDDFNIADDYFNKKETQKQNDLATPLTPGMGSANNSPYRASYGHLSVEQETVLNTEKICMHPNKGKSKTILGSIRSMLKFPSLSQHKSVSKSQSGSNATKIHSFLKFNGLTLHHQNVNLIFNDINVKLDVKIPDIDTIPE